MCIVIGLLIFILTKICLTVAQSCITADVFSDSSCSINSVIGQESCRVLNKCINMGAGSWGDSLYAYYIYVSSKVLGVNDDGESGDDFNSDNKYVYAMMTYTDSYCTIKNTENPMSILTLGCAPDSCCQTTSLTDTNSVVNYMIFNEVSSCPLAASSSNGSIVSSFSMMLLFTLSVVMAGCWLFTASRKGYTSIPAVELVTEQASINTDVQ